VLPSNRRNRGWAVDGLATTVLASGLSCQRAARRDGVDEDEQLPGAGDQRALVLIAGGDQPFVEGDELQISAKGCRQPGSIERAAQAFAPRPRGYAKSGSWPRFSRDYVERKNFQSKLFD